MLRPAPRLAPNLKKLLERLHETNVDTLLEKGSVWFAKHLDRFPSHKADTFPSRGSLCNWQSEEDCPKRVNDWKLITLFAFLHFRHYEDLPRDFMTISEDTAKQARTTEDSEIFVRDCGIAVTKSDIPSVRQAVEPLSPNDISVLLQTAIHAVHTAQELILAEIRKIDEREVDLSSRFEQRRMDSGEWTTAFDEEVENKCRDVFANTWRSEVQFEGEESLKEYKGKFPGWRKRKCVLLDGLDGTLLAAMTIPLWCSASVIYDSYTSSVIGSVVGLPDGKICVARIDKNSAWFAPNANAAMPDGNVVLEGHSHLTNLYRARIAFFGQKPKNLLSVATDKKFMRFLINTEEAARKTSEYPRVRLFNFAGNPIIVKLADRRRSAADHVAEGVDIVFEKCGQRPHDFVPGAFIALKMGAYMCKLNGEEITEQTLGQMMQNLKTPECYVIAATKKLANEFLTNLSIE